LNSKTKIINLTEPKNIPDYPIEKDEKKPPPEFKKQTFPNIIVK